jgi:serine/threonine-protein kinase HipA
MILTMISEPGQSETGVWIRLPGQDEAVVCGRVKVRQAGPDAVSDFVYGRSYLERDQAIPLVPHELPLKRGFHTSRRGLHGVLRDAAPDAWGRRVLAYRLRMSESQADAELTEIDYLLAAPRRPGALHFQLDVETFERHERQAEPALEELATAAQAVETDAPIDPALATALLHGTSVGGARPKALVRYQEKACIAKFSSTTDIYPFVRLETLALQLAKDCGLEVPGFELIEVLGKDALLVERFDIDRTGARPTRRHFFSALTALGLDEMEARYASYTDLADYLRRYGTSPASQCHRLFQRMVFNILIGNTDDHARNHALFWDGHEIALTPAYDLCVMPRAGGEASQAMDVGREGKRASLVNALSECSRFGLAPDQATAICAELIETLRQHWNTACDQAGIAPGLARQLMGQSILAPSVLEGFRIN